jgi:hypothetical protein
MNKPHHCPKCKSRNIDYECNGITFDENNNKRMTARGYCYDCDTHFEEHYLTEYQGVEIVDDNPWDGPMSAPVTFGALEEPPDMGEDEESIVFRMADFAERHKPK